MQAMSRQTHRTELGPSYPCVLCNATATEDSKVLGLGRGRAAAGEPGCRLKGEEWISW